MMTEVVICAVFELTRGFDGCSVLILSIETIRQKQCLYERAWCYLAEQFLCGWGMSQIRIHEAVFPVCEDIRSHAQTCSMKVTSTRNSRRRKAYTLWPMATSLSTWRP